MQVMSEDLLVARHTEGVNKALVVSGGDKR